MTSGTGSMGCGLRKVRVEFCLGGGRLTLARTPRPCGRCRTWFGGDGKVSIERWYLSPYVEKPFNSKVIKKSFVPELRSRKCFSCFGIPMFYVYMCVMDIMNVLRTGMNMYISHVHIWLCYTTFVSYVKQKTFLMMDNIVLFNPYLGRIRGFISFSSFVVQK